ncbi:MAG: hypothetical protein RI920_1034, partial [Pseudomonadota bacterium]
MSTITRTGQALLSVLEAIRRLISPVVDPLLDRLGGARVTPQNSAQLGMRTFEQQADAVMSTATTHRAQTLVRWALLVVMALIVWASLAKVDEVTKGDAKV